MTVTLEEVRAAIARLRDAGFTVEADDIDSLFDSAWTSSSELLGEIGVRLARILSNRNDAIPSDVREQFEAMFREVERTWPSLRHLR